MLSSCNYLEFDETSGLYTHDEIYEYFTDVKCLLTNIYSFMPQDLGAIGGAMRDCASDDAEYGNTGGTVQIFNNGNWSSIRTADTAWELYNGIRAANDFIATLADADFSRFQYHADYPNMVRQLKYFPNEARILRAYYFFELAKRYGDIPMPLKKLSIHEANTIRKTPFDQVIKFIVTECDDCSRKEALPDTYVGEPNNETGRITRGFALALKSKALLYAASPLHNPENDTERWKRAARAALDLIQTGLYQLDPNDKCNNVSSAEIVLARRNTNNWDFEMNNFPIRFTEGQRPSPATGTFPTQNLVDAFQTRNGYPVVLGANGWESQDPTFNPRSPYTNRDPRFDRTILANGNYFKNSTIALYAGGIDDLPVSAGGSPTGYFLRKYIQETTNFNPNAMLTNKHCWIIYRYAETLLTYAESMVEAFGSPTYTDAEFEYSAQWALNQVRRNASMPDVTTSDKEAFREALRNEWRVEFAFEDHRFWDIRRWKIGNETQRNIYGVRIERLSSSAYTYQHTLYETRQWNDRMLLYPIPQSEIYKNANLAPQNPGW